MKNYDAESALPVILQAAKDYDKKLKDRHFLMSVLHVLKNLEARNLISRNDKRTFAGRAISLTTGGIAIVEKNEQGTDILDRIAFRGFSEDEIAMFVDYLKRLNTNIDNLFYNEEESQI